MERLQKVLARGGVGSRRFCETLIAAGRVKVNGKVADRPGIQVDPIHDQVSVDESVIEAEQPVYYLLNKPKGFICSNRPRRDEKAAVNLVRSTAGQRLFCVGRLDEDSEGALILTNDGEFCNLVTHPRYGVPKSYRVKVKGRADTELLDQIRKGIRLAEGRTAPANVQIAKKSRDSSLLKVSLREGRNRHLRRVFAKMGLPVTALCRIEIGSVALGRLKPGEYRTLKPAEVQALMEEARSKKRGR
ncbi:MAG: pseudouridine synthase [Planctomycetota bacterium]